MGVLFPVNGNQNKANKRTNTNAHTRNLIKCTYLTHANAWTHASPTHPLARSFTHALTNCSIRLCFLKLHGTGYFAKQRQLNEEIFFVELVKQENVVEIRQSSADHILQHDLLPVRLDHLGGPGSVSVRLDFDYGDKKTRGDLVLVKQVWLWLAEKTRYWCERRGFPYIWV